jgi:myo-inositol-1-phosphate synthase
MRTGIWLVGGRGSVATTVITGAAAIRAGLAPPAGCVSELPPFHGLDLPGFDELVFGGHDLVQTSLQKRAEKLAEAGVLPSGLPDLVRADLISADQEILPQTPAVLPEALAADIAGFRARLHLSQVVVINVSSTEPPVVPDPAHASLAALRQAPEVLPSSSRYAYAALIADCPFVDFTPSPGICLPALDELAREQGLPYAGRDGKTGETLVKAALAPMFARRALRVRSWSGTNLLGGGDGASLADPGRADSKATSKGQVLAAALGYHVDGGVHIHNVPDLGDW